MSPYINVPLLGLCEVVMENGTMLTVITENGDVECVEVVDDGDRLTLTTSPFLY